MKPTEFIVENSIIAQEADDMHRDHEVQMARADCYNAAKYAIELHKMLKHMSEEQGLDGWVSEKITLANDYLHVVYEYMKYEHVEQSGMMEFAEGAAGYAIDQMLAEQGVAEGSLNESDKFTSWYDWKDQAKSSGYTITKKDDKIVALNKQGQVVGHWSDVGKFLSGKAPRPNFKRPEEQGVAEGHTPSAGELARDLIKMPEQDFAKKYGMSKTKAKQHYSSSKLKEQGVAEGSLTEGQYEMMMRNGQVKKFIAKDDADAKRIAAGHGAKSVIKLRGGVPAGKIAEQGVAEGSGGNWYIRVNGKILNDTKFKPEIFSSEDEARSHAMKLADKKRIPLSQIKLTKSWMDAPEQGVAEGKQIAEMATGGGSSAGGIATSMGGPAHKPTSGVPKQVGNAAKMKKVTVGKGVYDK